MRKGNEKCPMKPEFVQGMTGKTTKQQPNNHIPNQRKTRKVVI